MAQRNRLEPPTECCGKVWYTYGSALQHCKIAIHRNSVFTFEQVKNPIKAEMDRLRVIAENKLKDSEEIRFRLDSPSDRTDLNLIERSFLDLEGEDRRNVGRTMIKVHKLKVDRDEKTEEKR